MRCLAVQRGTKSASPATASVPDLATIRWGPGLECDDKPIVIPEGTWQHQVARWPHDWWVFWRARSAEILAADPEGRGPSRRSRNQTIWLTSRSSTPTALGSPRNDPRTVERHSRPDRSRPPGESTRLTPAGECSTQGKPIARVHPGEAREFKISSRRRGASVLKRTALVPPRTCQNAPPQTLYGSGRIWTDRPSILPGEPRRRSKPSS